MAYISVVHDMRHLELVVEEGSLENVIEDVSSQVADMLVPIDCGAAAVEADFALMERGEPLFLSAEGVV